MVGRTGFRAIFFIPVIIATGLISDIDAQNILASYMGDTGASIDTGTGRNTVAEIVRVMDVEMLFANMRVGSDLVAYVVNAVNNIFNIVNRSGVQMLIFLAGLQSISPAIYESCKIDGATGWETFWKITFPMISPMILVNAIYTIIDALTRSDNNVMDLYRPGTILVLTETLYHRRWRGCTSDSYALIVVASVSSPHTSSIRDVTNKEERTDGCK